MRPDHTRLATAPRRRRLVAIRWILVAFGALALAAGALRLSLPATTTKLYVSERAFSSGRQIAIHTLDPQTLADRTDRPPIVAESWSWALSDDGSTLVEIQYPRDDGAIVPADDSTIVVRDGRTGVERSRYHLTAYIANPRLSQDGSRLVVDKRSGPGDLPGYKWQWHVLDTASGRDLASVNVPEEGVDDRTWLDPDTRRLYLLLSPGFARGASGPWPVTLVAYDLTTSAEIGRLALPGVLEGFWSTGKTLDQEPVTGYLQPGLAVSPDGKRLAIVHGAANTVTLVDSEKLRVIQEMTLTSQASLVDRFLAVVGPGIAEAKAAEGTEKTALFAPDGRHLVVYGNKSWIDANNQPVWRGLGLEIVDLERGEIVAKAFGDEQLSWVQPAPDGQSLYAFGPTNEGPFILRHLDATSLRVFAERRFATDRFLAFAPSH